MNKYQIHHFATGGTIDSHWNAARDTAITNSQSIIPGALNQVRLPRHEVTSETICLKDSRELGIKTQMNIASKVAESGYKDNIVTTGTYLMADIANEIFYHPAAKNFTKLKKQVILTGSTIPISGYLLSDGLFNLGMSTAVLQENEYIPVMLVMNGLCLDVSLGVKKDLTCATFANTGQEKKDVLNYDDFTLISLGGSIDFELDELDGVRPRKNSIIPEYLRNSVNIQREFDAINPFIKDSRKYDDDDYNTIKELIKEAKSNNILITTGTYGMQKLKNEILSCADLYPNKTIVITASRLPLSLNDINDATFNLGYALGKIGFLSNGVHIAMNGFIYEGENILKELYTADELSKILD